MKEVQPPWCERFLSRALAAVGCSVLDPYVYQRGLGRQQGTWCQSTVHSQLSNNIVTSEHPHVAGISDNVYPSLCLNTTFTVSVIFEARYVKKQTGFTYQAPNHRPVAGEGGGGVGIAGWRPARHVTPCSFNSQNLGLECRKSALLRPLIARFPQGKHAPGPPSPSCTRGAPLILQCSKNFPPQSSWLFASWCLKRATFSQMPPPLIPKADYGSESVSFCPIFKI